MVLSNSRGPETLTELVAELAHGPGPRPGGGAAAGDLIVVSDPGQGLPDSRRALAGKVVMDTGNYYPERDGQIPELDGGALTSSELLARELPGA